jgi:hypothetical protein
MNLIPGDEVFSPVPSGVYLTNIKESGTISEYDISINPLEEFCGDIIHSRNVLALTLNDRNLSVDEFRRYICKQNRDVSHSRNPWMCKISPQGIRISPDKNIQSPGSGNFIPQYSRIITLLELEQSLDSVTVHCTGCKTRAVKKNGSTYFRITIDVLKKSGSGNIEIHPHDGPFFPKGKASIWLVTETKPAKIGRLKVESREKCVKKMPPVTSSAKSRKMTQLLYEGSIGSGHN